MRQLHDGAERHLPEMRHLRCDQRLLLRRKVFASFFKKKRVP
jgi:hypothetical protein